MVPISDWRKAHRLWSVRAAALHFVYASVGGLYTVWPAFQDRFPLVWFVSGSIGLSLATLGLRFVSQPGWDAE